MSLSPEQCRAARALLNWTQRELGDAAGITNHTVARFETGERMTYPKNRARLREIFEAAGVVFIDENGTGPGAYLRKPLGAP